MKVSAQRVDLLG